MRIVLITGANGYLARHLLAVLGARNDVTVIATSRQPEPIQPTIGPNILYRACDLADADQVSRLIGIEKVDTVIHTAAAVSNTDDDTFAQRSRRDNVDVQHILGKAAALSSARRLAYMAKQPLLTLDGANKTRRNRYRSTADIS